ncbi:MAG: 2-oxoglutarate dehydrogenase complex dihydrolipoyllysine-residue succinyltransferase [Gammaproteobacteria bacterium]
MSTEIKVPELPESITEATLVNWHKKPGEAVERDENLVDIETDKVVLEVPAPVSGVLAEIREEDGATVGAGDVIAVLDEGAEAKEAPAEEEEESEDEGKGEPKKEKEDEAEAEEEKGEEKPESSGGEEKAEAEQHKEKPAAEKTETDETKPLSPSVRRLVEEHDLDPAKISASGRNGRLTKADVLRFLESGEEQEEEKAAQPAEGKRPVARAPAGAREERRVPMSRMRARIAERMLESQTSTAMLTSFNEVDLGAVMDIRKRYKAAFEEEYGARLGFMSFFVKAAVRALRMYPVVNASIEENNIIYHDYRDIGVAVSTDRGLMVPVLRDCDGLSFAEIEGQIADYAKSARDGKIAIEDITGGTFTITNGGVFGSLLSTPIINPPQSAILGMHKIQERAMVVDGEVQVRPMMYIAITYDHRIVDGKEAVLFLVAVKEALEDPARLLIDL